jgi:site-specific DNA-methyltransferase (adenine-specific)
VKPYYQDDLVTLYQGDCLEVTEWLSADVLVTDPPYGVSHATRKAYGGVNNLKGEIAIANVIANDGDTKARDEVVRLWGSKPFIMFGAWKIQRPEPIDSLLIWHKAGMPPGPTNAAFMTQHEEIYVRGPGFRKSAPPVRSVITTNEHRPTTVMAIGHPTPKPIGLMETLIDRCIQGVIADPFAGSGATLIAARNLGKKAIGVELEEKYCELIATRLSQQAFDLEELLA